MLGRRLRTLRPDPEENPGWKTAPVLEFAPLRKGASPVRVGYLHD